MSGDSPSLPPPVAEALLSLCGAAGEAERPQRAAPLDPAHTARLCEEAVRHGLAGIVHSLRDRPLLAALSAGDAERCRRLYLGYRAAAACALRQLEELTAALSREGVPLLALKGAVSAALLYPDPGWRPLTDLDVLVPEEALETVRNVLSALGYTPTAHFTSPEEERTQLRVSHISPYAAPGRLPVEVHLRFLHGEGNGGLALEEVLAHSRESPAGWRYPCPAHFLLHAANHYMVHASLRLAELRWPVEMLIALRRWGGEIDPGEFWRAAARWGIESRVATVMATLRHYWGAAALEPPGNAAPLPPSVVLASPHRLDATIATAFSRRIALARELPDLPSRLRYLFRLAFPTPEHIRYRYDLPEGAFLGGYYLRYLTGFTGRLLRRMASRAGGEGIEPR